MTREEHMERHKDLHKHLDELVADFALHNKGRAYSNTSIMELLYWSHMQTLSPDGETH